jgi:hypothetical protein
MLFGIVALGAGLSGTGVVYAADDATFNRCWGQTTKEFAALGGEEHPGLGEHSSSPPGFEPGEGGRDGVGNVSEDDPRFGTELSAGGQGVHANFVGAQMGLPPCEAKELP